MPRPVQLTATIAALATLAALVVVAPLAPLVGSEGEVARAAPGALSPEATRAILEGELPPDGIWLVTNRYDNDDRVPHGIVVARVDERGVEVVYDHALFEANWVGWLDRASFVAFEFDYFSGRFRAWWFEHGVPVAAAAAHIGDFEVHDAWPPASVIRPIVTEDRRVAIALCLHATESAACRGEIFVELTRDGGARRLPDKLAPVPSRMASLERVGPDNARRVATPAGFAVSAIGPRDELVSEVRCRAPGSAPVTVGLGSAVVVKRLRWVRARPPLFLVEGSHPTDSELDAAVAEIHHACTGEDFTSMVIVHEPVWAHIVIRVLAPSGGRYDQPLEEGVCRLYADEHLFGELPCNFELNAPPPSLPRPFVWAAAPAEKARTRARTR